MILCVARFVAPLPGLLQRIRRLRERLVAAACGKALGGGALDVGDVVRIIVFQDFQAGAAVARAAVARLHPLRTLERGPVAGGFEVALHGDGPLAVAIG